MVGLCLRPEVLPASLLKPLKQNRFGAQADIPYPQMWDDDRIWLPQVLAQEQCGEETLLF